MPTGDKYFTPERAQRSLVLCRRIVRDLLDEGETLTCLGELLEATEAAGRALRARLIREELSEAIRRYQGLYEELRELGAELVDPRAGVLEFPCRINGSELRLTWRYGDACLSGWHEVGQCAAAARPLKTLSAAVSSWVS